MKEREALIERVLRGPAKTSTQARQAAFANHGAAPAIAPLIDKVANTAWKVTDEDVSAVRQPDEEIFEQVVAAAVGKAKRQLDAALAALEAV